MIEFDNVSLRLGRFSLDDVSFTINKGDYYFILGPSGAGKTVILEAIAGLHRPDFGRVLVDGVDVGAKPPEKRKISLVYQDYSLFPHMTVFNNVAFGLKMQKKQSGEIERRVNDILDRFGILHLKDRHPLTMSGGEQQRVALARSLVVEPDILLLDEPLSALDQVTREKFIADLRDLHRERDLTIVQVSHSRDEPLTLANHIAVIIDGRLEQEDTPDGVFNRPVNCEVASFVGMDNILKGTVIQDNNGLLTFDVEEVPVYAVAALPVGASASLCLRGDDVTILLPDETTTTTARNNIAGTIVDLIRSGPLVRVKLDCGFPLSAFVTRQSVEEIGLKPGDRVLARFKATSVHVTR